MKTTERGGPQGDEGATKLCGRKRHLLVDTLGLVVKALVPPADLQERAGAPRRLLTVADLLPRLELIWAASADVGPLQTWVWRTLGWRLQILADGGAARWAWTVAAGRPGAAPASAGLSAPPATVGRRADLRLDRPQSPHEQRR